MLLPTPVQYMGLRRPTWEAMRTNCWKGSALYRYTIPLPSRSTRCTASWEVAANSSRWGFAAESRFHTLETRLPISKVRRVRRYLPLEESFSAYPCSVRTLTRRCVVLICSPVAAERSDRDMPSGAVERVSRISRTRSMDCTEPGVERISRLSFFTM